ncbi:FHA domain-containing protein [Kitasatospora sp. NPDC005748]|uniref:FHA domain-containing protein n=1 Tax=Kitasatospora sp. NPDC005748 TaxID=3157063 RepID=UPI003410EE4A
MSSPSREQALPRLVVDTPGRLRGEVFELTDRPLLVGRDATCQIRVGEPGVSRRHAVVQRSAGHTTVEDLASTNGTRLNGHPVHGQEELHAGDVLDFGPFEVHYEDPWEAATAILPGPGTGDPAQSPAERPADVTRTAALPLQPEPSERHEYQERQEYRQPQEQPRGLRGPLVPPSAPQQQQYPPQQYPPPPQYPSARPPPPGHRPPPPGPPDRPAAPPYGAERRFEVGQQQAGNLSNVAGDQYNYVTQARRESFFREIAATRTRARHLVVAGFLLFVVGGAVYGWAIIRFIAETNDAANTDSPDLTVPNVLGPEIGGMPVGAIGFGVAAIGSVLILVGIVLHIVVTSRRRRFESAEAQRLQAPPPR